MLGVADAAITEAAALIRVTVPVLVGFPRHFAGDRYAMLHGIAGVACRCVAPSVTGRTDGETAVHGAGVQLRRLGQTDGEPEGQNPRESAEQPTVMHVSNIDRRDLQGRVVEGARTMRPSAAMSLRSVSGAQPTTHRTVVWNHVRSTEPRSRA